MEQNTHENGLCLKRRGGIALALVLLVLGPAPAQELVQAVRDGDLAGVERLLAAGANPDELESWGTEERTPLMVASDQMDAAMVKVLLKGGARVNFRTPEYGKTALMHCVGLGESYEESGLVIGRLFLAAGAKLDPQDANGLTALMWAVEGGSPALLAMLLDTRPKLAQTDSLGETALHRAVKAGRPVLVALLMKAGGDASQLQAFGRERLAPIHSAVDAGDLESVRAMLDTGGAVNCRTKGSLGGQTPLHRAVSNQDVDMVTLLLRYKPDLKARDDGGETALQYAAQGGGAELGEIIRLLTKAGAR